jgi:hypothetical protein
MKNHPLRLHTILFALGLLLPALSFASITVKKIKGNRAVILFEESDQVSVGDHLKIVGSDSGRFTPFATVLRIFPNHQAGVQIGSGMIVKEGVELEHHVDSDTAAAAPGTEVQTSGNEDRAWHFGVGGSYSLPSTANFNNGSYGGLAMTVNLTYASVLGLEFEARKLPLHSWGFVGGLSYDLAGTTSSVNVTVAGTSSSGSSNSQFQTTVLWGSAAYRWENFYLPFGLNYDVLSYTPPSGFIGSSTASGGFGGQVGVGYYVTPRIPVELDYRMLAFNLSQTTPVLTTNYGSAYATTFLIKGEYLF